MSNSKNDEATGIVLSKRAPKITPPGYEIQLSMDQATAIAEFVESPVFKILKNAYVAQRKDHIARRALNSAQTLEYLHYFKGMAAELVLFFQNMEAIKKTLLKDEDKE